MKHMMRYFFQCLALMMAVLLLSACDQSPEDKEYAYFKHPDKLKALFQECQAKGQAYFENTPECGDAYTIAQKFSALTRAFIQNQQAFGQEILRLQVAVYEAKDALLQAQQSGDHSEVQKLITKIHEDQLAIKKLRAIVAVFVAP